jgi:acylphosphatase
MTESQERSTHVKITGKVQRVGFRAFVATTAKQFGIVGWVRNRKEGWVEAILVGDEAAIEMALQDCYDGPPAAIVDSIEVSDYNGTIDKTEFFQKPTI